MSGSLSLGRTRATRVIPALAAVALLGGCALPWLQDIAATRAALAGRSAEDLARQIRPDAPLVLAGVELPPPVAYEWLAIKHAGQAQPDDAVLALMMSALLYVERSGDDALVLALYDYARQLRARVAAEQLLAELAKPLQEPTSLPNVLKAMQEGSAAPLRCRDQGLQSECRRVFRKRLTPEQPIMGTEKPVPCVGGDRAAISATALSFLQSEEDFLYIERYLASGPLLPELHPYLRAVARQHAAIEARLLTHPSSFVRANALIALGRPAPQGEQDMLIRAAGAFSSAPGARDQAIRTLEGALTDERHAVRLLAMVGLAKHGATVPRTLLARCIATTPEWCSRYVPCVGRLPGGSRDWFSAFLTLRPLDQDWVDGELCEVAYGLLARTPSMTEEDYLWLLGQLRPEPTLVPSFVVLRQNAQQPDGYPREMVRATRVERINNALAEALGKHAAEHPALLAKALESANPFTRLYLVQAAAPAARDPVLNAKLWQIAEGKLAVDDAIFRRALASKTIQEIGAGLGYGQVVNEAGVREGVKRLARMLHRGARQAALSAVGPSEADLGRLLADEEVAQAVVGLLLVRGPGAIEKQVPTTLLSHRKAEVRLAAGLLLLTVKDEPAARRAVSSAIRDPGLAEFAARVALATQNATLSDVVRGARGLPHASMAGHLIRRIELEERLRAARTAK